MNIERRERREEAGERYGTGEGERMLGRKRGTGRRGKGRKRVRGKY